MSVPLKAAANGRYATAVQAVAAAGTVTSGEITTVVFDVEIPQADVTTRVADEYIIRVNGRVIKRMTSWQARRLGLLQAPESR